MRPRWGRVVHALLPAACWVIAACACLVSKPAVAQSQAALWSGQAQCQLTVQSQGFVHQEVQTWTLTGGPPTQQGAMRIYPATWSVIGQGSAQRSTLLAQWKNNVPATNAPIDIFIRASDNKLVIKSWHAQLVSSGGTLAVKQIAGVQTSTPSAVSEWIFPQIEADPNAHIVSGVGAITVPGNSIAIPSASATGVANCKWQFSKGVGGAVPATLTRAQTGSLPQTRTVSTAPSTSPSTTTGASQNCEAPSTWQGSSSFSNPIVLGTIQTGASISSSSTLSSATDRRIYQVSISPGLDANISLDGLQAGSDFDLYIYNSSFSPIGCSLNSGTAAESFQTQFGSTQTSNNILIEVGPRTWSAAAPNFTLTITGTSSSSLLASSVQNRTPILTQQVSPTTTTTTTSTCQAPSTWQGSSSPTNPTVLGTIQGGTSITSSSSLSSATDRRFYQISLPAGANANISLSGMQAGSDFDLYAYDSSLSPIGCSLNNGTTAENFQTQFGNTQTSNTVLIEVGPRTWSSSAPNFTLVVSGSASATGVSLLSPTTATRLPTAPISTTAATGSGTTSSTSSSGTQSSSTTSEAGHSFTSASQLSDVRGDFGSDIDNRSTTWSSTNPDDYYRFSLVRSQQTLTWPPLYATITVSGLQSTADFDVSIYSLQGGSLNSGPFFTSSHNGSASFVTCITEDSRSDVIAPPDIVIALHSRSVSPYQLTIAGNKSGQGCSTIPTSQQAQASAPFPSLPIGLNSVSGNTGSDVTSVSGNWIAGAQDVYYTFGLTNDAGTSGGINPPALKATVMISGLQSGADFDSAVYTTKFGSGSPFGSVTHTGSGTLAICITAAVDITNVNSSQVVVGLHARAAGPYQVSVAGNTLSQTCQAQITLPGM